MICKSFHKVLLSFFMLTAFVFNVHATHIVGGELYYRNLGDNNYEVTLIVYRDCAFGVPPFDHPASIGIFDNPFYNLYTELLVYPLDSILIPPTISSPCFIPPTNICYRKATYRDTVNLPVSSSGYWLVYQRCCRNNTILNIVNPEDRGATYTAFIPGSSTFSQNSNPVFNALPPPFICQNIPFTFDHSATDAEGDSIVYELCNPLDFASPNNPIPQPPFPPPYSEVPWQPPYSSTNILGGTPLSIDPVTGEFTCTPSTVGQFVFGVCVSEFRNGIYLSTTRRDYQVNVVACNTIVVAAIQNPILNCEDNSVTFINQSVNAGTYSWNFGDSATLADTSSLFEPTYVYPDTGAYTVELIAYSPLNTACNDTVTGSVYVYPGYSITANAVTQPCSPEVHFADTNLSVYTTVSWNWDFGDGANSTVHNPNHIYAAPGNYDVLLTGTNDKGCTDTALIDLLLNYPDASVIATPVNCYGDCNGIAAAFTSTGSPPLLYQWNDPLSQATATANNLCPGIYTVTITDSLGCTDTTSVSIEEPLPLQLNLLSLTDYCNNACIGYAIADVSGGNSGYIYSWDDPGQQSQATAVSLCAGMYSVLVNDSKGCTITDSVFVPYLDSLPFVEGWTDDDTIYSGQSTTLHATTAEGYIYNWSPAATLSSSSLPDPVSTPQHTTHYVIEVTDSNGCRISDTVAVVVLDVICGEPLVFIPNAFTPNGDQENDVLFVRGNVITTLYFSIYDRWGEKVFETERQDIGWNGTFKGKPVHPGVFVYYIEAVCHDQSTMKSKGNITVIR